MKLKRLSMNYYIRRKNLKNNYFVFKQDDISNNFIKNDEQLEPFIYDYIKDVNGTNIIEIGSNLGLHTLNFADLVGDDGKVYAFEHDRLIYYQLCANIISNGYDNIYAYNINLSDDNIENDKKIIDQYNFNNISLIKVNSIGHEFSILKGMIETIKNNNPVILIKIDKNVDDDVIDFFRNVQYDLNLIQDSIYLAKPNVIITSDINHNEHSYGLRINHIYNDIKGWFDFQDIYTEMVNKYDNALFVELGGAWGKSSSYMAVEIANSKKNIKFDVVDKWDDNDKNFFDNPVNDGFFINKFKENLILLKPNFTKKGKIWLIFLKYC